ncbi:hypothetical protein [Fictibacillus halophilus]|uniref:hypothetical protein n=1 Tax=Fictibacillus halophilus TaxID=1610490 RepID=UPI001CFABAE4|nr:hypothetical protein [Fictibacillus halophilus]
MKKLTLIFLLFLLSACSDQVFKQPGEAKAKISHITLKEVKKALADKEVKLSKGDMVSQFELKNLNQAAFHSVNKDQIYIYEFPSSDDRVKGYKQIKEQTQLIDIAHFPIYLEQKNVLVIYMKYPPKSNELENKIRDALKSI